MTSERASSFHLPSDQPTPRKRHLVEDESHFSSKKQSIVGTAPALKTTRLEHLKPNSSNILIVAQVVHRAEKQKVKRQHGNYERWVLNFSCRDAPHTVINVTCWGNYDFVNAIEELAKIGVVVDIKNPRLQIRPAGDRQEIYRPTSSSPFFLSINEGHSTISMNMDTDLSKWHRLLHLPTKSPARFFTISELCKKFNDIGKQLVNILVVLRKATPVRVKTSTSSKVCDIVIYDQTSPFFFATLWNEEAMRMSTEWTPNKTVLYLADVRLFYNRYYQSVCVNVGYKGIITVDPNINEAASLANYARTAVRDFQESITQATAVAAVESTSTAKIVPIKYLNDVLDAMEGQSHGSAAKLAIGGQVSARLSCYIADVNVNDPNHFQATRCASCHTKLTRIPFCLNPMCAVGLGISAMPPVTSLELQVSLADHSGMREGCILTGHVAEEFLGYTAQNFLEMDAARQEQHLHSFLLNHFEVTVTMLPPSKPNPFPQVIIQNCKEMTWDDTMNL